MSPEDSVVNLHRQFMEKDRALARALVRRAGAAVVESLVAQLNWLEGRIWTTVATTWRGASIQLIIVPV